MTGGGASGDHNTVEAWRVRAKALRAEAESMLSCRPNRNGKSGEGKSGGGAAAGLGQEWVYRYLLFEPLTVSTSASGAHSCVLAGSAAPLAAAEGALYTATFGEVSGSTTTLDVRLFPSIAPKSVSLLHNALSRMLGGGAAAAGAEVSVSGPSNEPLLTLALPAGGAVAGAKTPEEVAVKEAGKLQPERAGLLCLLLPVKRSSLGKGQADGGATPTGGFAQAGAATSGASLVVSVGATRPECGPSSSLVVVGRILDGGEALKQLLTPGAAIRLMHWKTSDEP